MKRIQNIKNGRIAQITDSYEKGGVVINYELTYEDDGSTTNLSTSTIKRWWKEIKPEATEAAKPEVTDSTAFKVVVEEIVSDAKAQLEEEAPVQKVERKEKKNETRKNGKSKVEKKSKENANTPEILEYIDQQSKALGINSYVREKQPTLLNYRKDDGKCLYVVHKSRTGVDLNVKSKSLDIELAKKLEAASGFYDKKLVITELTQDNKSLIDSIINSFKEDE